MLSPERSVEIQCLLGADIQMQLDECIELPASHAETTRAMELSLRWAERSRVAFARHRARLARRAGAVRHRAGRRRGGPAPALGGSARRAWICPATRIGGLAVGEGQEVMLRTLEATLPFLPAGKPRYLMGVGTPSTISSRRSRAASTCSIACCRRATAATDSPSPGAARVNLRNAVHADDPAPLDPESTCPAARDYSRAYLHHLVKSGELLGAMLLSWINTAFYQELMAAMRTAIRERRFAAWAQETKARIANPLSPPLRGEG